MFFGGGAPLPFLKALRCCGGAALLLLKEWRAAKAPASLVVLRRCCPSSGRAEGVACWQRLRDWAQAAGHVTPYFMGGPYLW